MGGKGGRHTDPEGVSFVSHNKYAFSSSGFSLILARTQEGSACTDAKVDKHAIVRFKLPDEDEDGNLVYKEDDPADTADKEAENGADEDGSDGEEQVGRLDPATEAKRMSAAKRNHERLQGDSLKRLRHIEHAKRQRIEGIDMYGEYGTKVSLSFAALYRYVQLWLFVSRLIAVD